MNDTRSTPDEPDGRGSVVTGEQSAVPGDGTAAQQADAGRPAGNGTAGGEVDGAADGVTQEVPAPPSPGVPAGSDAPTTELRLPTANGSAPTDAPEGAAPANGEVTDTAGAPPVQAAPDETVPDRVGASGQAESAPRPSPAPRAPEPAPGPVPGPGPDAAVPPPWHRMQGPDEPAGARQSAPQAPPQQEPAIGGLLDDGPTAFLEAPVPAAEARGAEAGSASSGTSTDSGNWATVRAVRNRPPRQAALQLKRLDPWSVLKLGLVLAVVLFFIWLVAVGVLYGVLDGMGVWDRLNGTYADLVSGEMPGGSPLISAGRVFGFAAVIGAINSLLFAVAVTVGAFVYNVSADLVGGIEVTLSERD